MRTVDPGRPGVSANRTFEGIHTLFQWATARDVLAASPCVGISKPPAAETSRDRVLSDSEIRWLWQACDEAGFPFGPLVKLLLLTGQRRGEVGGMTYDELAESDVTIPASEPRTAVGTWSPCPNKL